MVNQINMDIVVMVLDQMHVHNFLFILHNQEKKFILSLYYNESNSFLCVNVVKMYQFKAKDFEVKPYLLCLGNISKDFTTDKMKKRG